MSLASHQVKKLETAIKRWKVEPDYFAYDVLGIKELDPVQVDILRAFGSKDYKRIAVKASTGTGKTFAFSIMVWNFLTCYGEAGEVTKGLLTSIDGPNMEANLWSEIARMYNRSELLKSMFLFQDTRISARPYPKTWFVERRTWDKKAETSADPHQDTLGLAGHHAKYSLFLVDESGGVPDSVILAGERTLVNVQEGGFQKVIQGGNPTHRSGPLYNAFRGNKETFVKGVRLLDGWALFSMNGDPDDPKHSTRVDLAWNQQQIDKYGRDYPWVMVYVLGEFPNTDIMSFLGVEDVREAMARDYPYNVYAPFAPYSGLDVAYGGEDKSFFGTRQGLKVFPLDELVVPLSDPQIGFNMAGLIQPKMQKIKGRYLFVDATGGYANAVMEALRTRGINPTALKYNAKASDSETFENLRTELHFKAAQWVKNGGALPYDPQLLEEAVATQYTITKKGKMLCEPKEIVKARLKRSPDKWDTVINTFAIPDRAEEEQSQGQSGQMKSCLDIHPFGEYIKTQEPKVQYQRWR